MPLARKLNKRFLLTLFVAAASAILFTAAFGRTKLMRFDARDTSAQKVYFLQGAPVVQVVGTQVLVTMGPADSSPEKDQRINFYIRVQNLTGQPINIFGTDVSANRADGESIRVWKALDVRRDIAKRADGQRFAASLAAALGNTGAAYANSVPGQQALAAQQRAESYTDSQDKINRANNREALEMSMVSMFLDRETVLPGQYYFGFIQIDPPDRRGKETAFRFQTHFAGETLQLEFQYGPAS